MGWMGLSNLSKKNFSIMLVNEFYFGILRSASEFENLVRFRLDVLCTFFDGQERLLLSLLLEIF